MKRWFAAFTLVALVAGCNLIPTEPYIKTNYFDLGFPDKDRQMPNRRLVIREFRKSGPYLAKMVFRNSPNHLSFDEYNRWSMEPTELLERYFVLAYDLEESDDGEKLELEGEILQFEGDLQTNEVKLILRLTVRGAESDDVVLEDVFRCETTVDEMTANEFAKGMKIAVDDVISQLDRRLLSKK